MKTLNYLGEEIEVKMTLKDILLDRLAEGDTAQEICDKLIEKAKDGDGMAIKTINNMIGNAGIKY